jgi:glutathione S-transferase
MKLYYSPGACSLAVHIALREADFEFELDKVDLREKKTASGEDYNQVNAKGYVPALRLDDGQVLTENAVVLQYVADQKPQAGLAPPWGSMERYRLMEWLSFISTEIHKTLGALFNPKITPEWRANQVALFGRRADWLAEELANRHYLLGDRFCVADGYLFTVLRWCRLHKIDTVRWPVLNDFQARVTDRPAVQTAMKAEGLIAS